MKHAIELAETLCRPMLERAQAHIGAIATDFCPYRDGGVTSVTARRSNADHLLR